MDEKGIGEIVESGTTAFIAECLELPRQDQPCLYDPPPFGSFVKVLHNLAAPPTPPAGLTLVTADEPDPFLDMTAGPSPANFPAATYALVYGANTTSLDNRRPSALGLGEHEIISEQPQIFELLRTEFHCLLIAYSTGDGKGLRRHLPPRPPRIHSRVFPCSEPEIRALTEDLGFLRSILLPSGGALAGVPSDELAAACLRQARDAHPNDHHFLLRAGKTLATLLAAEYERLQAILHTLY